MASDSSSAGRFEVQGDKFAEMTKDKATDIHPVDLKEALPALFSNTELIPRLVGRVWRRACDEIMSENRGMYHHKGGTVIQVYFFEATPAIAKAKSVLIRERITSLLPAAKADESVLDAPLPQAKHAHAHEKQGGHDLAKLMKEGLPENPSAELLKMWVTHATQDMATSNGKVPLTHEMMDMAAKADIAYHPLWSPAGQAVVGSAAMIRSHVPQQQWKPGEAMRLDLAVLFGAVFQMYSLQMKGTPALMIVPARVATLGDKDASELYFGLLRRLSPEVRKNLIVNIKGMPKDTAPASAVTAVETVAQFARAYVFETGLLSYPDFARQFPKLHAAGFDSEGVHLGEHEQVRHMKKYAAHYKAANVRTFVTHVTSKFVLDAAVAEGFGYVSGPLVRPAQKTAFAMQKLPATEVGKG